MIHRHIKLKNIGIRRDADGKFYAVIADFGLSTVELDTDVKKSDILQRTLPVKRLFLNIIKKLPKYLNWVQYFFNIHSKNVDDEILPNPYERPSATELFEELEVFETTTWKRLSYDNPITLQ